MKPISRGDSCLLIEEHVQSSQVIVVARSAFSYAAALLSTGKVYQIVDPLFPAMDHWVKVNAMQ